MKPFKKIGKKTYISIVVIALAAFVGFQAYIHIGGRNFSGYLGKELTLNAEQKTKISVIADEMKGTMKYMKQQLLRDGDQFSELFNADVLNQEALKEITENKKIVLNAKIELISSKISEIHALLEPEQRQKASEMLAKMMKRWAKHGERRGY